MRFEVELLVAPWEGDHRVRAEDAWILYQQHLLINGVEMKFEHAYIDTEEDAYDEPPDFVVGSGLMTISLHNLDERSYDALGATEQDWILGSTREDLVLPVASLSVRESPVSTPSSLQPEPFLLP